MKYTSTLRTYKLCIFLIAAILTLTLVHLQSYAQTKNFATVTPGTGTIANYTIVTGNVAVNSTAAGSVTTPENASSASSVSPAVLTANYFSLTSLIRAEGEAYIELKYNAPLAAGKTSYIPFDTPTGAGLTVDLLGTVGGLTGLFSSGVVQVDAYSGATATADGTQITTGVTTNIVVDGAGRTYFAVTSATPYNALRVHLRVRSNLLSLSLGSSLSMNVYTAFNYTDDTCAAAIFSTVGEGTGLNVSLTSLVSNPQQAIDGNLSTFSQLQAGLAGVGSTISQTIYMNGLAGAADVAKVYLSQTGTILSVNVLSRIRLQAYNGTTAVGGVQSAGNLINLQLLTASGSGVPVPVYFSPGAQFDRIRVTADNTVALGGNLLTGGVNINEVQRTVAKPAFNGITGKALTICGGSNLALSALNPNPAFTYNFYKKTGNSVAQVASATAGTYTETAPAAGTYLYYITAQKQNCIGESDLDSVTVTVNPALVFGTTALGNASAAKPYSRQINPATGGTPAYAYALAAGSLLPAGITLSPAGLISGTPATAGTYPFNVTATDSFGCTQTTSFTLTVTVTLALPAGNLPAGTTGAAYTTIIPSPTGGTSPYTLSAANVPPGLQLNPVTRELSGTPTQSGSYTVPVTATDADGNTVTTNFTVLVRDPLVLSGTALSAGTTGQIYPAQIIPAASGGSGIYTYTAASALPPGLSFNPATREITGTPAQSGAFTFQVNVTDNEGRSAVASYTVTVNDPLVLATATLPDGMVGTAYPGGSIPVASGGTGPYTYVANNLPPGLSFDPLTREITGTPVQSGMFTVSVTVTDNAGASLTTPYTIRVLGALDLPAATLAPGTVGTPYSSAALPAVTGGTAPYTYSMANLPNGLTFDPATRIISGTPATGGQYTVTMTAADSGGLTTSTDYALVIGVDQPVVAPSTICSGNVATLTVNNPVNGVTYNFYPATGNTPLATGPIYTTVPLNQTTTFYVEAVSGTAVSQRVPVTVTVNPTPAAPAVITNNLTITAGQTALLQATADAGSTISWYAGPTGGVALGTGNSFTTPALTATTTYYAGATNSNGCSGVTRTPVTVTVINATGNPVCNAAASQQSNITGLLCVACAIQDPGNSTDADPSNFTQIRITAGVGATGYQRLIFQRAGMATDSIRLNLETPTGLLDLSALGGITINVMNGSTVVRSYPLNNSLVSLGLTNGNRFNATVVAGGAYDRVEVSFSPTVNAVSSLNIYGAQVIYPNPTFVSGSQTVCSGTAVTLNATAQGGTALAWYDLPAGGTLLSNTGSFTTPALTTTTTYYVEISKGGCANPSRVPVVVTVIPAIVTPVLTAVPQVCSGSAATLSVSQPQSGVTYNWYTGATGGTAVATGAVFVTPSLTANTTYYLEAANGNCTAGTRVPANVVVNARPALPQITASATTVTQGQTVRLSATSQDSNVTFNWYDAAGSVTPVFTGPDFVTPPITGTTTFYLDATSSVTGCASSSRVQQTITVTAGGTAVPVGCEPASSQTSGVTGTVSVLARVDNAALAVDNDQQTASTLSIPVGLNAAVFQKLNFTGLSTVGDTLRIRISSTSQLLSLGLLSNVTLTTYQGAAGNNDGTAVNSSLVNLQLLNGGTEALLNLVPATAFDGVEIRLNSGLTGALSAVNLNYARRIAQAPAVAADSVAVCANATATLTVSLPQTGVTYKWYDANGNYLGNDGTTFITPPVTASTVFYVEASRSGCGGSRTAVQVTLVPAPAVPQLLAATEQTCQNANLVLQVQNPQAGVSYRWYRAGVLLAGETNPALAINNIQTGALYAVEAVNSCGAVSAQATDSIAVGALTAPVITPQAAVVRTGEQTLLVAASSTSGLTYTWYTSDPSAGSPVPVSSATNGENGTFITPNLTATTTFYVTAQSASIGGCTSAAAAVTVTVTPAPVNPGSVGCELPVSQSTSSGGTLSALAGVANPAFAIDDDAETASSLFIPLGLNSYVAQKVNFSSLSQPGDTVRIRLTSPASLLSLGVASAITVTSYNGNTSNGDAMTISNPALHLELSGSGQDALVTFVPTATFDGIEVRLNSGLTGALTGVDLNYIRRILAAPVVAAAAVSTCEGASATLAVNNPAAGITYAWYRDNTLVATTATYQTPANLAPGVYTFEVSAARSTCPSTRTAVVVTVLPLPAAPVASPGNPLTTCQNTPVTLGVEPVAGVSFNWYDAPAGGNLLASNTNTYTTAVFSASGTVSYYVEAVNTNNCAGTAARTVITVTVNPPAAIGDLTVTGAENPVCAGSAVTLTANSSTVLNPVFTWYTDQALTNAVFTGAVYTIDHLPANTDYYVTVRGDNKCESVAATAYAVLLQTNPTALASDITITEIPLSLCAGSAVTLTASSATVINPVFTWYTDAALTNAVFTGPSYTTSPLVGNTNFYVTVQGANKCANLPVNAKVVLLTVNPPAVASDINVNGVPAGVCAGSGIRLTASSNTVINPVFTWYTDAALTNAVFTGPVFDTPSINGPITYYVTVHGDNKCENVSGTANAVVLNSNPAINFTGAALPPSVVPVIYAAQLPVPAGGTPGYSYIVASGSTLPPGLSLSSTGLLSGIPSAAGNYTFNVTVSDAAGCNATATFTIAIGSTGLVTLPAAILPDGTVGTAYPPQTLPGAVGGTGPYSYVASNVPAGFSFDPDTRVLSGTPTLGGTFTFSVTATDAGNLTAFTNYVVTVTVPAPAVPAAESCNGSSALLMVSNPVPNVIYNWYASAAGGTVLGTGPTFQTPPLTVSTTYYAEGSSGSAVSTRTPALVTVRAAATAADIVINGIPASICSGSGLTLTASSPTISNPVFNWYSDVNLTTLVFTGDTFAVPPLTNNTSYFVTVSGTDRCENLPGTAAVAALNVNPALDFNATVLGNATAGAAYAVQLNSATGGTPVYTYSLAAGSTLPAGLNLSATGLLSGTPAAAGGYAFTVAVTDSRGCTATAAFNLVVNAAGSTLSLPPAVLADGQVGSPYPVQSIPAATGGTGPYVYTASGLPPGLVFNPQNLEITGIPALGGTYNVNVNVVDAAGATATGIYTVTVTVPDPSPSPVSTCPGSSVLLSVGTPVAGVMYNWYAAASGGPVLFSGTSFQTPAITAAATYYVEGVSGIAASSRIVVNVNIKPSATSADINVSTVPAVICPGSGVTLTATSGTVVNPVFTWYTDAALTNAVFTGSVFTIPSVNTNTTYYVSVRGDNFCENTTGNAHVVPLIVNPAIHFDPAALSAATAGIPYNAQIGTATGGTPEYTYMLASGNALPAGLSLSGAGLLSGTPATAGNYNFQIVATDSQGCNSTASFSLLVNAAGSALALQPANLPDGTVGTSYPIQTLPEATGGTGPFTYSATGLPPGLQFDPLTRNISGTPLTGGTYPIVVTVTDANGNTANATYPLTIIVPAPVAADVTACAGNSVTLTVGNPVAGIRYNWYNTPDGGTALFTGTSFTTPPVNTSVIYYVQGASGTSLSTRTAVNVNVRPSATSADIVVSGVPAVLCSGSGATLTASSNNVTNPVFTWYTDPGLTNAVFTGPVYVVPALAASTTYYVTVRGDNRCENLSGNARTVTIDVNPALVFNGGTLSNASAAAAYAATLTPATGGTPAYTYSIAAGSSLPAGLILSASGVISGAASVPGNYVFSVTVTDSKGCNATAQFSLIVGPSGTAVSLPPATLPDGTIGVIYPGQTLPAPLGGTGPYSYTITGLPPGLTFDPGTRTVTGTPVLGGTFIITGTATDANGQTASQTYTITVAVPDPAVAGTQSCDGSSVTLLVSNPVNGVTYNWYNSLTGGNIIFTGSTFQTPVLTASASYYVEASSGTAVSRRVAVPVSVLPKLETPVVSKLSSTFSSITFVWTAVNGATSYEVSTDGGSTWRSPSSGTAGRTQVVSGLQANQQVMLLVRAQGSLDCQTSDSGTFTGVANNNTGNDPTSNGIFIPNTFTPNGDGKNEVFTAYGNGIASVRMNIYDQWGHVIYQSSQMENGWDGTYRGQPQPNGVYVYMMDIVMQDGTNVFKKGTVTLLK